MNGRVKDAFDKVHAEETLKEKTRLFLIENMRESRQTAVWTWQRVLISAACLCFVVLGGHRLYFTPTAEISIDINPSVELGINRFDRVISVTGFNDDGKQLANALDIRFLNYSEAVSRILEEETVAGLLSDDGIMTIAVAGPNEAQSVRVLEGVRACTGDRRNAYCYSARAEEAKAARELGLSCGRYREFQEIQKLNPEITPEEINQMSMREIRDLRERLSSEEGLISCPGGMKQHRGSGS